MSDEQYKEFRENLEEEFSNFDYPVYNPMEMASDLSDGSETVFKGDGLRYPASKFATQLRQKMDECSNEGFPYESSDALVEDTIEAMKMDGIVD